ncbi:leucine-rich repeat domain-containing protein [Thermoflexibacter ruber]|uniref:Leucine Rich repeat-containing protein n=1 Tax=Thermoflexibacter ruber TaxID=1003 RepID=A0A1I2BV06_9BACT|nr:leucine-rich repeat domain-containing protein [Thermoflexibacter ruber]SFE59213.1 Leucine Rich repeat-containing protein [Thermoflexibacter ruber]
MKIKFLNFKILQISTIFTLLFFFFMGNLLAQQKKTTTQTKTPAKTTTPAKTNTTPAKTNTSQTKPATNTTNKPANQTNTTTTTPPDSPISAADIEQFKKEAKEMMSFLEYSFNLVGASDSEAEEKETVITQSYAKVFKDSQVSIEDDLDKKRDAIIFKEVQAYLKDIDFFFDGVVFKFDVQDVSYFLTPENQVIFKVTMNRNLRGKTVDGDSLVNNQVRYVEINLNQAQRELKIASIYTNKVDETEELKAWWTNLSPDWKGIFGSYVNLPDTVSLAHIKNITALERIDLSTNKQINDIEPLNRLTNLKEVNLSNTSVSNLLPLRNLSNLEILNCSNTQANSLEALKYSLNVREIYCNNSQISDLEPLRSLQKIEKLYISNTPVSDLSPISGIASLRELRCENTRIKDLSPLANLQNLVFLDISNTPVADLSALATLSQLERLDFSNTQVSRLNGLQSLKKLKFITFNNNSRINDLSPLSSLTSLEKIYCDKTGITKEIARKFNTSNAKVLVIYDSEMLSNWWNSMNGEWKLIFNKYVKFSGQPTKDQLQQIANLTEINIANNQLINTLEPLKELTNLKKLYCGNTNVSDLSPLKDLIDLQVLECNNTKVSNLRALENLTNLERLNVESAAVTSLEGLGKLHSLKLLYADKNTLSYDQVDAFNQQVPSCLVIHQTETLRLWWQNLPDTWKTVFGQHVKVDNPPTREQTHQIATLEVLKMDNNTSIRDLEPIRQLRRLKELYFNNTLVSNIYPLMSLKKLERLDFSKNPISDIAPLTDMISLKYINMENTPVKQLTSLQKLVNLEELRFSGTQVDDLESLKGLTNLKIVEFFSTRVSNLKHLEGLPNLKVVKCYNTKVWKSRAKSFQEKRPEVELIFY